MYSEKATKFCEIFPLLLTTVHTVKSKGKISQKIVAFSEYMNFNTVKWLFVVCCLSGVWLIDNLHFQSYEVKLVFDSKDFSIFVGKKKNCAAFDTESLFSLTPYLFWTTLTVV